LWTSRNSQDNPIDKEETIMKIAIPVAGGKLCMHFGHCESFAVVDVDEAKKEIIKTEYLEAPPHEPGLLPRWLGEKEVTTIIAGGMGQRAQSLFADQNISVIVGAPAEDPETIVNAFLAESLESGENACDH
jgi:ATP-binding protein involved in chromosome partitioning